MNLATTVSHSRKSALRMWTGPFRPFSFTIQPASAPRSPHTALTPRRRSPPWPSTVRRARRQIRSRCKKGPKCHTYYCKYEWAHRFPSDNQDCPGNRPDGASLGLQPPESAGDFLIRSVRRDSKSAVSYSLSRGSESGQVRTYYASRRPESQHTGIMVARHRSSVPSI